MKNNSVDLIEKQYHRDGLKCGLTISAELGWKHAKYEQRSKASQDQYDRLEKHLSENGMLNPLITFKGSVLIGQRRYEIMKSKQEIFDCLEVNENVYEWNPRRVPILTQTVHKIYNKNSSEIPKNL